MKWIILSIMALLAVPGTFGATIQCFGDDDNAEWYTARVFLTNMDEPPSNFPNLNNCGTAHRPGFNDTHVRRIIIMGNSRNIPNVVCRSFPNAVELIASGIQLDRIQYLTDCHNLEVLDLSGNSIVKIQANQFTNTHLRRIDLSKNKIVSTDDDSLVNMDFLEVLNLSQNPEIEIAHFLFQYAVNLKNLNIAQCGLGEINISWMNNLTDIVELDISYNPLGSIPSNLFYRCRQLEKLTMSSCGLLGLNAQQFQYNTRLVSLNMRTNEFTSLEGNLLRNQTMLQKLYLSNNQFVDLPDEVFSSLGNLQILEMRNCNINKLVVSWFASMNELRTIDLSHNSISEIPYKTFGVENSIQTIYMQNNKLRVLKATSFALLQNLVNVRVDNNAISAVDSHFLQQPNNLRMAWFLNNECVNINIDDFNEADFALFSDCFENFDRIPIEMETSPGESYRWYSMRWSTLVVHVKAYSNVSIVFSDIQSEHQGSSLKIQIGMDRNLNSFIYENDTRVWERETPEILNQFEWRSFVISWEYNVLQFFKEGWQLPSAMHIIRDPFEINFFGVRADTHAAFYIQRIEENFLHADFPVINPPAPTAILPTTTTSATTTDTTYLPST